jgi:hypothetical protein
MGFVYPGLKPMLEASIRRVTVTVKWSEGKRPRELEVTQFLTRPQEGQLMTADQNGLTGLTQAFDAQQGANANPTTNGPVTAPAKGFGK